MKKILCILLAAFLSIPLLSGCAGDTAVEETAAVSPQTETTAEPAETEPARPALVLPNTDFEGAAVTIMSALVEGTATSTRFAEFLYDEELAGEGVNDAVLNRNNIVEDLLNVDIVSDDIAGNTIANTLKKQTKAGDTAVDVYTPYMENLLTIITEGYLINLYDMPVMDIENEWWDTAINRDLGIAGKVYMQGGDILLSSKELHCYLGVNRKILSDYGIEMPYQLVFDGIWTMDAMYDLCCDLTVDLNGDGILNQNDQFGYTHTKDSAYWMFVDAGGRIAALNESGKPELTGAMEQNVAVLEKMAKIYADPTIFYDVAKMPEQWTTNREMFMNDQVAMQPASIYNLQTRREMVSDFGILPYPKYDENQQEYMNCPTSFRMQCITVPVTETKLDCVGSVLEALAYHSKDTTVEAYYEANLQGKVSRDEESAQMLDIIFSTITYDLIESYRWGSMFNVVCNGIADPSTFVSAYTAAEKVTVKAMEKTYSFYSGE